MTDILELIHKHRQEQRDRAALAAAERALEAAANLPAAQYAEWNAETGEAVIQLPNGTRLRVQVNFNSLAQSGDEVILDEASGGATIDQASGFDPEEPVAFQTSVGKLKILYYTPDGGLWIGGDRRTPVRIATYETGNESGNDETEYFLANTGASWIVTQLTDTRAIVDGINRRQLRIRWVNGRTVEFVDAIPDGSDRPSIVASYMGAGWVSVTSAKRSSVNWLGKANIGDTTLYNLTEELTIDETGTLTHTNNAPTFPRIYTYEASEVSFSFLVGKTQTHVQEGSWEYSHSHTLTEAGGESLISTEAYSHPQWVGPNQPKPSLYASTLTEDPERTFTQEGFGISPYGLGQQGGWWSEFDYEQGVSTEYFNGIPTSGTVRSGKRTIARGQLYTCSIADFRANGSIQVEVASPGFPWTRRVIGAPYFKIPANAIVLDYRFHP